MHLPTHILPSKQRTKSVVLALCLLLVMLSIFPGTPAQAADAANRQQAIEIARQQNGGDGKVLGVQTMSDGNGQTIFAVKILSNGRVRVFRIRQAK
ncbi:hypothetical protein [Granulosicoccus antarcticus]|uniref:PepSY domain-containing protein n=1 Tax=Granulosicoccus antarcticus IMCC3135 TaxID=1192854 RepID=A0A2Z2NZ09_9GAMM|nr:hypothetical protein [Granulosicoccus antarcticus]ASJ75018.1 hypothetical protein IMCC3135_24770 [Granulosicoccus antarcticus IMCC3135]